MVWRHEAFWIPELRKGSHLEPVPPPYTTYMQRTTNCDLQPHQHRAVIHLVSTLGLANNHTIMRLWRGHTRVAPCVLAALWGAATLYMIAVLRLNCPAAGEEQPITGWETWIASSPCTNFVWHKYGWVQQWRGLLRPDCASRESMDAWRFFAVGSVWSLLSRWTRPFQVQCTGTCTYSFCFAGWWARTKVPHRSMTTCCCARAFA